MSHAPESPLPRLATRLPESHKGTYGRVLLVGGSKGMAGAIALAGKAALRSGAGLVQLAIPNPCLSLVASFEPSYMTAPLPADTKGRIDASARRALLELAEQATVVAIGPGLSRSKGLDQLVAWLYRELANPLVVDADGLNALSEHAEVLEGHSGPRVLTPHPAEFARLTRQPISKVQANRDTVAHQFAKQHQVVLILKGHRSVIADGVSLAHNVTGNPGMATGGTGDVLTGVVAGLMAQGLRPFDAARLAAHVHGLAGDLAAAELGQISLIASDVVNYLPAAFKALST